MKKNAKQSELLFEKRITDNRRLPIQRFSPFLLLAIFFIFYFFYIIFSKTATTEKIIVLPFLIANMAYVDFAVWNYFEGKQKGIIWLIESLISALITYLIGLY